MKIQFGRDRDVWGRVRDVSGHNTITPVTEAGRRREADDRDKGAEIGREPCAA